MKTEKAHDPAHKQLDGVLVEYAKLVRRDHRRKPDGFCSCDASPCMTRLLLDYIDELVALHAEAVRERDEARNPVAETQHVIEFRSDGWTIMHPLACRPDLFSCKVNRAAEVLLTERPEQLGRFACWMDDDGELVVGSEVAGA